MDYLEIRELYHHGIKGQKWGIRRYQNEDGTLTAEGRKRYDVAPSGQMSKLGQKQYQKDLKEYHKEVKTYKKEHASEIKKEKIANRSTLTNASIGALKGSALAYGGATAAALALGGAGVAMTKIGAQKDNEALLKAGIKSAKLMGVIVKTSKDIARTGAVVGAVSGTIKSDKYKKELGHSDITENDIEHSGIKGQKWGVRRYQNPDGTLTDAGKARYNSDGSKKRTETMSNDELERANRRLAAERNYNSLMGRNYKNRSSNTDIAIRAGASAIGSALASGGAYLIREAAKNPNTKIGKEKLVTASMLAALGATIGGISSVATSLGGQTNIQNIGDQKKKK